MAGQSVCLFLRHPTTFATMPKKYVNPVRRCGYRGAAASKWARTINSSLQIVRVWSEEPVGRRCPMGGVALLGRERGRTMRVAEIDAGSMGTTT